MVGPFVARRAVLVRWTLKDFGLVPSGLWCLRPKPGLAWRYVPARKVPSIIIEAMKLSYAH